MFFNLGRGDSLLFVQGKEADQQAREEENHTTHNPHKSLADPEGHAKVEHQHRNVQGRSKQVYPGEPGQPRDVPGFQRGEPFEELKHGNHRQTYQQPATEVAHGDTEVPTGFPISVDLTKKPALALEGHRIDDDVEEDEEKGPQDERLRGAPEAAGFEHGHALFAETERAEDKKRHGITAVGEKDIG